MTGTVPGRRPGRGGYVAAVVVLVVTVVAVVLLALTGVGTARDSSIRALGDPPSIEVGQDRIALYVRVDDTEQGPSARLDTERPGSPTCSLTGGSGRVELDRPGSSLTVNTWERIAVTPQGLAPGTYGVECGALDGDALDGTVLGAGVNPPIAALVLRFVGALAAGALGVVLTIVLVAVTAWRRHRAARAGMTS